MRRDHSEDREWRSRAHTHGERTSLAPSHGRPSRASRGSMFVFLYPAFFPVLRAGTDGGYFWKVLFFSCPQCTKVPLPFRKGISCVLDAVFRILCACVHARVHCIAFAYGYWRYVRDLLHYSSLQPIALCVTYLTVSPTTNCMNVRRQ